MNVVAAAFGIGWLALLLAASAAATLFGLPAGLSAIFGGWVVAMSAWAAWVGFSREEGSDATN